MSKIQLYVKSLTGGETVINCLNNITVYDLKKLINEDEPYMLRLIHNSKELDDEQFLNQIDIKNGSIIGCLNKLNREVEILLEIKRKMNLQLNWDRNLHLRNWERIEIDESLEGKYKVTEIKLDYLPLNEEIPKEIGKLFNLKILSLSLSKLTGEIPKEIQQMKYYKHFFK